MWRLVAGFIGLLMATSASANEAEHSKFLATFEADGVTTTFTQTTKWDSGNCRASTITQFKGETIFADNAQLNFESEGQKLSVSADKISYKRVEGQKVGSFASRFTFEGHVVFNYNRDSKGAMNATANSGTLDLSDDSGVPDLQDVIKK